MIEIGGRRTRVVDAHVHVFPTEIGEKRADWLLRDDWFRQLYENPSSRLATTDDLLASMDSAGVDHAVICGFPWSDIEHCRYHCEYMLDAATRHPTRLSWLGVVP